MNLKNPKNIAFAVITFVIIFLMNYIGSDMPDRLYRATLTAFVSVIGLGVGMWIYSKNKDGNHPDID